jgi:hypothetical protein
LDHFDEHLNNKMKIKWCCTSKRKRTPSSARFEVSSVKILTSSPSFFSPDDGFPNDVLFFFPDDVVFFFPFSDKIKI